MKDQTGFLNSGRLIIVYSVETNPWQYVASTLQYFGIWEKDLVKLFLTFLRQKIPDKSSSLQEINEWPMPLSELI